MVKYGYPGKTKKSGLLYGIVMIPEYKKLLFTNEQKQQVLEPAYMSEQCLIGNHLSA